MGKSVGVSLSIDQVEAIRECERSLDELLKKVDNYIYYYELVSSSHEGNGVGFGE